jgi:hypothetical protein
VNVPWLTKAGRQNLYKIITKSEDGEMNASFLSVARREELLSA